MHFYYVNATRYFNQNSCFRHKSYLTLGVQDNEENIVGVMTLAIYPNIPALLPGEWEKWLQNMYGLPYVNSYNTLWIRLLIWHPFYYSLFFKPIVQYLFNFILELKFLLMLVPPVNCPINFVDNLGNSMWPKGKKNIFQLHICILDKHKKNCLGRLKYIYRVFPF